MPLDEDLVLTFVPGLGPATVVPAGTAPGSVTLDLVASAGGSPLGAGPPRPEALALTGGGAGWHVSGHVPFAPARLADPALDGLLVTVRDGLRGPAIRLGAVPAIARAPRRPLPVHRALLER